MLFRDKNNNCLDVLKATFGVGSFFSKFGFIWFRYVVEYVFPFFFDRAQYRHHFH